MNNYWRETYGERNEEFIAGVKAGIKAFATWKDGEQFVGCLQKSLKEVLKEVEEGLTKQPCTSHFCGKNSYDSLVCLTCGKSFGWYCIKSPDHTCHYRSTNGKIELIDGTMIDRPKSKYSPDPEYENEDSCIFCGLPEERK